MTFSLVTTRVDGAPTAGLVHDGRHYQLADLAPELLDRNRSAGLMAVLADWAQAEPILHAAVRELETGARNVDPIDPPSRLEDWLNPLQYPNKVVCTGFNYLDHVMKDGGRSAFSKEDNIPVFFLKPPTTTLVGQGRSVRYPTQSQKFDSNSSSRW